MRCTDWLLGWHCTAEATHYLLNDDGDRVPGAWCESHASTIVAEYEELLGWHWTMQPIEEVER